MTPPSQNDPVTTQGVGRIAFGDRVLSASPTEPLRVSSLRVTPDLRITAWDIGEQAAAGKPPLRRFGSASVQRCDPDRHSCPDCGFIWEACECDLAPYRGAFDTEGRH